MVIEVLRDIAELEILERQLPFKQFTRERSSLAEIDLDFPSLTGYSFIAWLNRFSSQGGLSILEVGGGPVQRAVREILGRLPESRFVGLDIRPLAPETSQELSKYTGYGFIQAGISKMAQMLDDDKFRVIFAHNLADHLPNPFYFVESAYDFLTGDGILFINKIPIYQEVAEKIQSNLERRDVVFSLSMIFPPSELVKANIMYVSLAIKRTTSYLRFPIKISERYLNDIEGTVLATHVVDFDGDRS